MALTDTKIRNAKPEEAAYRLTDTGGLYLQISPSGGKLWRWNYWYNGKQKTMPFGKYPEVTLCNSLLDALAEIGFKDIMTGHGYRGLASAILADNGFDKAHIKVQLAHADENNTEAARNHARYLAQQTALMQRWAEYLVAELKKGKRELVTIRKTA